jgi:hypothetical protein
MRTRIIVVLTLIALFGFASQSMGVTAKEKMTPVTGSFFAESKPVPPVSSSDEMKILSQLKEQDKELKRVIRGIAKRAEKAEEKRNEALNAVAEATKSKAEADKELVDALKSFGSEINNASASTIKAMKKSISLIVAFVALGFAFVFWKLFAHARTLERIEQKVDNIPGRTAEITGMWEIDLGSGITYRPPLSNGKRLSLRVPEGITGEYLESSMIPRVPTGNLAEMEDSVTEILVKYYNNEYDPEGLQARVIRYAIDKGELRGLSV